MRDEPKPMAGVLTQSGENDGATDRLRPLS
jgi:hypothetical protein